MIAELGHFCLLLAGLICIGQIALSFTHRGCAQLALRATNLAIMQFTLLSVALLALLFSYADSDFSVYNVYVNSHSAKPFIYKLTGTWGNHEGSMLLWTWILSLYGALIARQRFGELTDLKPTALGVQAFLALGFISFLVFTSNPFARIFPEPMDGQGLNPLLQDIGLAIHPPMLYLGYVGFGIVFALGVAGLIHRRIDQAWAKLAQRWIVLTWAFLSAGIALGSWWAYRELGWGGWWFWDPVENVSLMPWLAGTALLHTNMVLEKRNRCGNWVALLSILTFSLSLIGTFIVRSGLLTSVHAFASDPERGTYILAFFAIVTGGAFLIWSMRQVTYETSEHVSLFSREGLIMGNNILLLSATATILLATLYPLFAELLDWPAVSIGPPYFNQTVLPLLAPLALMSAIAPQMGWRKGTTAQTAKWVTSIALCCVSIAALLLWAAAPQDALWLGGVLLGTWLCIGTLMQAVKELGGIRHMHQRVLHLPSRRWGMLLSHLGVGIFIIATTLNMLGKTMLESPSGVGKKHTLGAYEITYKSQSEALEQNFLLRRATLHIQENGNDVATLQPETRFYPVRQMLTNEAAIDRNWQRDIYAVIGQTHDDQPGFRLYIEPAVVWLWISFMLIAGGGFLAWFRAKKGGDA